MTAHLIEEATDAVGWYTAEWVVRERICRACNHTKVTIEVPVDDLRAMMKEGGPPTTSKPK